MLTSPFYLLLSLLLLFGVSVAEEELSFFSSRQCQVCHDADITGHLLGDDGYDGIPRDKVGKLAAGFRCGTIRNMHMVRCLHSCVEIQYTRGSQNLTLRNCITGLLEKSPGGLNFSEFNGKGIDYFNGKQGGEWKFTYCDDKLCWVPVLELVPECIADLFRYTMVLICITFIVYCCYGNPKESNKEKNLAQYAVRPFNVPERVKITPEYVRMLEEILDPNTLAQEQNGESVVLTIRKEDEAESEEPTRTV